MDDKSLALTTKLLKSLYPHAKVLIRLLQSGNGYLNLPPSITNAITRDGLLPWSTLYEDSNRLKSALLFSILGFKNASAFAKRIGGMNEMRLLRYRRIFLKVAIKMEADGFFEELENIRIVSPEVFMRWFNRLSPEQQNDYWKDYYLALYAFIPNYINLVAIMTFGVSMCDLVSRAKSGDDDAFYKAVQIDKSTLVGIPYFRSRFMNASLGYEPEFLQKIGKGIQDRPVAGKIKHKNLLIMLVALEEIGFSELTISRKYEVLSEIGVYGPKHHQYDTDSLRRFLSRHFRRTGHQIQI